MDKLQTIEAERERLEAVRGRLLALLSICDDDSDDCTALNIPERLTKQP